MLFFVKKKKNTMYREYSGCTHETLYNIDSYFMHLHIFKFFFNKYVIKT